MADDDVIRPGDRWGVWRISVYPDTMRAHVRRTGSWDDVHVYRADSWDDVQLLDTMVVGSLSFATDLARRMSVAAHNGHRISRILLHHLSESAYAWSRPQVEAAHA